MDDERQGIVHVIGPEQGFTLPGTTVVCGDSHTSTHGAFGAFAIGIGTSEVEHTLATQTLVLKKLKNLRVQVDGELHKNCASKDVVLHIMGAIGAGGGAWPGSLLARLPDLAEEDARVRAHVCVWCVCVWRGRGGGRRRQGGGGGTLRQRARWPDQPGPQD